MVNVNVQSVGHFTRFAFWFLFDAPTWPTMLNPEGISSCSPSGRMALIMSSDGSD